MADQTPPEFRLAVAGVVVALRGDGAHRAVLQEAQYQPFLTHEPPAAVVDVTTAEVAWDTSARSPQMTLDAQTLTYHTYGAEGDMDAASSTGRLQLTADVPAARNALANYLRVVYALLLPRYGGFLFHSAGLIRNGRGYLFYGHSGSGKTTVSRLSRDRATLLSDDLVAVRPVPFYPQAGTGLRQHDGVWHVHGTPFWGELRGHPKTSASAPLRSLFSLVKDRQVRLEPLSVVQATADVVSSVPVTYKEPGLSQQLIAMCADLAAHVPGYRLHFTPDDSFWSVIDELA